jgi:molecular chaperone DnaK (HSP70)
VGQLVLHNLPARPAGVLAIRVTIDVDLEGDILITAEEAESGVSEKTIVRNFLGEHHCQDEVEEVDEAFRLGSQAEEAEQEWSVRSVEKVYPESEELIVVY